MTNQPITSDTNDSANTIAGSHVNERGEVVIPIIEEAVVIGKREVISGEVSVRKSVSIEELNLDLTKRTDSYNVERRPVGELLDSAPPAMRTEGNTTIYSVIREVPVVVMRYELVEELHVTHDVDVDTQPTVVSRRVEHLDVTRNTFDTTDQPTL